MPLRHRQFAESEEGQEHSPFISQDEIIEANSDISPGSRRSSNTRDNRFSLQDMEYPEANIPLDSHPLLDEAILTEPGFLRQEVGHALGSSSQDPTWLPYDHPSTSDQETLDDTFREEEGPVFYPDTSRNARESYIYSRRSPSHNAKKDLTYEIPMITLNTADVQSTQVVSRDGAVSDLETGLFAPPETPISRETSSDPLSRPPPGSPSKFSGFITRISNRIAGSDHPPTPTVDKNASSFWINDQDDHNSRHSTIIDVLPSSSLNEISNASATSVLSPSSPLVSPKYRSHNSSMESVHSLGEHGNLTPQNLSLANSRLTRSPSLVSSSIITDEITSSSSMNTPSAAESSDHSQGIPNMYSLLHGKSLGCFPPSSSFRKWSHKFVSHRLTNLAVTIIIILQTALLARRQWNPLKMSGYFFDGYSPGDITLVVINCLYTAELFLKTVAYGLYDDRELFENLEIEYPNKTSIWNNSFFISYIIGRVKRATSQDTNHEISSHKLFSETRNRGISRNIKNLTGPVSSQKFEEPSHERFGSISNLPTSFKKDIPIAPVVSGPQGKKLFRQHTFFRSHYLTNVLEDSRLKRAFLRDSWQRLDFASVFFFWISLPMSYNHWDARHHIMIFRALSCLRILRLCKLTDGTSLILQACESCIPQLIDVGIFIACFWVIIGVVGIQSFKSSLSRHCVWTNSLNPAETYVNTDSYCGSYLGLNGITYPYLDREGQHASYPKGFRCPVYSVCKSGENPYGGTVNFDNIFQSMQMVFVLISVNTFSDIMYDLTDTDSLAAALFFIAGIFILTVWLMNIFIAIIVSSFKRIQLEAAEEEKRIGSKPGNTWVLKLMFNNGIHSTKVRNLIQKKPLLRVYYRFEFLFVLVIIASLITQSFRDSEMSDSRAHILYRAESAYTLILLLEIVLRFVLYVPDVRTFFLSRANCFDLTLAVITSLIILEPIKVKLGHAYYWLTFFQCARFYRVVLLSRITSDLWMKIFRNFKPIYDLTLFYFILLFLSGIIIARYFEGTIPPEDVDDVEFAMHTLPNTLMSLYVITSTENWADIMYELQEHASSTFQRAIGSMMLVLWFILTNLVVMNIFIAVIAASLEISIEGRKEYQVRHFINDMTDRLQTVRVTEGWIHKLKKKTFKAKEEKNMEKAITNLLLSGRAVNEFLNGDELEAEDSSARDQIPNNKFARWFALRQQTLKKIFQNPFYSRKSAATDVSNFNPAEFATRVITERRKLIAEQDQYLKENPNFNVVLYMLAPRHALRRLCQKIVPSSHGERIDGIEPNKIVSETFSILMFLSTIGIVVTACYQTPLYRSQMTKEFGKWNWTFYIDTSFMVIFTLEFLVKVLADGLLFTPNAYARSPWNWLDFGALDSLWIEFIAFLKDDSELSRIVRGLKALRALRILTISETAKNNFHYTMLSGFGKILSAAMISLTLLLPFSVWGLNIFNGRLGYCLDGSSSSADCVNEFSNQVFNWEIISPNVYVQPELQLDNFKSSFSALYQIVSLEGWVDLMINVMQSTGRGTPQEMFASPVNGLFVIFFNFVSTVFILTLFVSVIISNYSRVTGRAYLTPVQVQWYHVKKFLLQVKPSKRQDIESFSSIRRWCYRITVERNKVWTLILNLGLLLHIFVLLLEAFPSVVPDAFRYSCFMIVSSLFLAHYIMLIIAQKFKIFAQNKWNVFSIVVAAGAWNTTILAFFINADNLFINVNKIFLVGLLIFLFPRSDRLSQLLKFASASFPSLFSLMFTWFVMFLMYAIAMNQIFGMTKIGPNTSGNINLRSVPKALVLLFRCSFGEGWNYIMDDFTLEQPFCHTGTLGGDSDCGSTQYAYVLFMSWNVISMYIMLNLFVSLILDSFSYIAGGKQYAHLISRPEVRKYKRCWQKLDPKGTGFISPHDLPKFLHSLDGALSFHFYSGILSVPDLCSRWISRNSLNNPYDIDIDLDEINNILSMMNIPKIQERRRAYEQFIEKAIMNMKLHEEPGISFSKLLVQLPLYNSFNQSECLIFIDYMEADLLEKKVSDRLRKKRCHELIEGYACRWRYLRWKRGKISTEKFLKRKSLSIPQTP